jgi:hypothetical protein
MEALIFVAALVTLSLLALRFGTDSRPTLWSEEHRLAARGMVWDAKPNTPAPAAAPEATALPVDGLAIKQVIWAPLLAETAGGSPVSYPTLTAIDLARGLDQPAFATDPHAALLERHARAVIEQSWSDLVWLTGVVDQARFDGLCTRLDHQREILRHMDVVVLEGEFANGR